MDFLRRCILFSQKRNNKALIESAMLNNVFFQTLYDSIFLMSFNVFFSSMPILVFGVSEQNFTDTELLKKPHLYRLYKRNYLLSINQFILWMSLGVRNY